MTSARGVKPSSGSENPSSLRRNREKEARRQGIISAAIVIFARDGFFGAKLDDVAELAGFSRSGLYLYFPDGKEELYAEALTMAVRERDAIVREVLASKPPETDTMEAVWLAFGRFYRESPEYVKLLNSLGFEDIRVAVDDTHFRPVVRQGTETFRMLDESLRDTALPSLPQLHLAWIAWSLFTGVVQFQESLEHLGFERQAGGLLESALAVIRSGAAPSAS